MTVRNTGPGAERAASRTTPFMWAMMVLTVLALSRAQAIVGPLAAMRPAMLMVMVAGVYAFLRPSVMNLRIVKRSWPPKVLIALAVTACLSVPFGISIGRAGLFVLTDYWKILLYTFLLMVALQTPADLHRVIWAVVVGTGLQAFLSLFYFGISKSNGAVGFDANDVGLIMVTGLPLALMVWQTSKTPGKIVSFIAVLLVAGTIARSQSRGAFVGLLAVGTTLLVMLRNVSMVKRLTLVGVAAVALAVAAPSGYWDLMGTLKHPEQDYNWTAPSGRREVVKRGIGYMIQYPVFGIGVNNFPMAEGLISDRAKNLPPGRGIKWSAAHNTYVQAGAEMGFTGLILWLLLVIGGLFYTWKLGRRMPSRWKRGTADQRYLYFAGLYLPLGFVGFAVSSTFVSFAYIEPVYILAALAAGLQVFAVDMLKEEREMQASKRRRLRLDRSRPLSDTPIRPLTNGSRGRWDVSGPASDRAGK